MTDPHTLWIASKDRVGKPYGLIADLHMHNWSAFSSQDEDGRNSRLMHIIAELERCCEETRRAGGSVVVIAGDLFHVRGSVTPSVFNPVRRVIDQAAAKGIQFLCLSGNHDLESRESEALGSSVAMLSTTCFISFHKEGGIPWWAPVVMAPWVSTPAAYKEFLTKQADTLKAEGHRLHERDLICHIGIDGTLTGNPNHGVSAEWLATLGYRRVFSGHFHNHKDFGNGVYSVGAATHQTFSDIGTKAGFMIVHPDRVQWFASHAPSFIDLDGTEDPSEIPLIVDGQFVRARVALDTALEVNAARKLLMDSGAAGVTLINGPKIAATRVGASVKSLDALEASVDSFITEKGLREGARAICADVLAKVKAA